MAGRKKILALLNKVEELEQFALETEKKFKPLLRSLHLDHLPSGRNLLHYLAIRSQDLRSLQNDLSALAISSHSHSEAYTLNNLKKIKRLLQGLAGMDATNHIQATPDSHTSADILKRNAAALFGKPAYHGQTKLMVTLPTEAADDYSFVVKLVKEGMHIARINTAHDDMETWQRMIRHCRRAAKAAGHQLKIYMDLVGPHIRTGSIKTSLPSFAKPKKKPAIMLYKGQILEVKRRLVSGHEGSPPVISFSIPQVFDHVKKGESVWFDDGKLGGIIRSAGSKKMNIEITHAPEGGFKLREAKGVNFPDSDLDLPALTKKDIDNLPFICANADMIGLSFVRTAEDIKQLQKKMKTICSEHIGIILKIETREAFDNLPSLLFQAMQSPKAGIMVARGDLAVELGLLRMAEVQEELLWLAEAAHMPIIWATAILDTQMKEGIATRAEISDVVKATRAECALLNKGPYIFEALKMMKEIDKVMTSHEEKKLKLLRSLNVAKTFIE